MQNDPVVSKASELLRLGLMPTPEEVEAGKVGQVTLGQENSDTKSALGFDLRRYCHSGFSDEAPILKQRMVGTSKKVICTTVPYLCLRVIYMVTCLNYHAFYATSAKLELDLLVSFMSRTRTINVPQNNGIRPRGAQAGLEGKG